MELVHAFHPDHKLTYKKRAGKGVVCAACDDDISSEHYGCGECKFFLHKLCAERPSEFTHSLHPIHPLCLLPTCPSDLTTYPSGNAYCDACGMTVKGFIYHCAVCTFDLDFICAFRDKSDPELRHVFHRHKLTRETIVKRADKGLVCAACLEQVLGPLADYYSCRKCNFFLHELCVQRPLELTSPLHPQHELNLLPKAPYLAGMYFCGGCQKDRKGFVYNCNTCSYLLDFKCAFPETEKSIQSFDNVHDHPLMLVPRPAKFNCDLCSSEGNGSDEEDHSYICSIPTCNFWVHKMCAFRALTQRYKGHNHLLSLVQGVPEDLQIYLFIYCDVCRKTIYPTDWVSYCSRCTYFVHVMCMVADETDLFNSTKDAVDYLDDSFFKLLLRDDKFKVLHWPPKDIISELIQPFFIGENSIGDVQPKIRHFSHDQHDMVLFKELCVNNDSFFEEEDEEIMCDACIHPITAPYYCCQECNYYLHLACVNLPDKIKHFSHSDELNLGCREQFYHVFKCGRCGFDCNGFSYGCDTCDFYLDLTCAALPEVIMHKSHDEHLLFQMQSNNDGPCYGCGRTEENGSLIFKCIYCDVHICYDCAIYSGSIRHRWDRNHSIDLKFPPHDHPDHFMCDMCEELMHPKLWLYSCFQCEISFHPQCVPTYQKHPNMKFGRKIHISSHPHVLKDLIKSTLKTTCDKCEGTVTDSFRVYECETCYDCFCHKCVESELS